MPSLVLDICQRLQIVLSDLSFARSKWTTRNHLIKSANLSPQTSQPVLCGQSRMKQGFIEEKHAKLCISQNSTRMLRRGGPRIIRNGGRWIGNMLSGQMSVMSTSWMTKERFGSLMQLMRNSMRLVLSQHSSNPLSISWSGPVLWRQIKVCWWCLSIREAEEGAFLLHTTIHMNVTYYLTIDKVLVHFGSEVRKVSYTFLNKPTFPWKERLLFQIVSNNICTG